MIWKHINLSTFHWKYPFKILHTVNGFYELASQGFLIAPSVAIQSSCPLIVSRYSVMKKNGTAHFATSQIFWCSESMVSISVLNAFSVGFDIEREPFQGFI